MAIFYVKKIGNDTTGNGSAATPWASVYKASQMVTTSGNTIYISGGTYTENNECSFSPGVSIQGEGKNVTIIQTTYSGSSYSQALFKFYSSNFTNGNQSVSGISFNGMNYVGKRAITVVKRSNVTIHDCDFLNFDHTPASFYGDAQNAYYQPATWLTGNKFYNNTVTNCSAYSGSANQGVWWQGHDGFELYNCVIINNRGAGVGGDLVSSQTNKRTKIHDCTFERSAYVLPYWAFACELRWEYGESEIYNCDIQGCIDICFNYKETYAYSWWIHDNQLGRHIPNGSQDLGIDIEAFSYNVIVERNTFNYLSAGITIARSYQSGSTNDNLIIRNNLFTNIGCTGTTFSGQVLAGISVAWDEDDAILTNTKIYNNTFKGYTNGRYGVLMGDKGTANNVEIKNNIIVDFTLAPVYAWKRTGYNTSISNLYIQYNDFYNNGNSNNFLTSNITPSPLSVTNISKVNPLFISSTDYRLQSGSTLINAGIDVTIANYDRIFTSNYEDGLITQNSYNHFRFSELASADRYIIQSGSSAREGNYYAKVKVMPGDNLGQSATQERAELYGPRDVTNNTIFITENTGTHQYSFSTKLDSSWTEIPVVDGGWGIVFQIHPPAEITPSNPTFALSATDKFRLNMRVGDFMINPNVKHDLSDGTLNIGSWIDWKLTIKYTKSNDGYVILKRRNEGQPEFTEVFRLENTQTLQYNDNINGGSAGLSYVKYGLYRSAQPFTSIMYNDNFSIDVVTIEDELKFNGSAPDIGANEYGFYYVSPNGDDVTGVGTLTKPWASLYKATSTVSLSGSTIIVKAGTYIEPNECQLAVGVNIIGDGIDSTKIISTYVTTRGHDTTHGSISLISATPGTNGNQTISGFTLDGSNLTGCMAIVVKCRSNVKIHDISIQNFLINGITFQGQSSDIYAKPTTYSIGNEVYNCLLYNNCDGTSNWNAGGNIGWYGQDGLLIHDNIIINTGRTLGLNGDNLQPGYYNKGWKLYNNKLYKPESDGHVDNITWKGFNFHMEVASQTTLYTAGDELGGIEIYGNEFYGGNYALDFPSPGNKGSYDFFVRIYNNYFENNIVDTTQYRSGIHLESLRLSDVEIYDNNFYGWTQPLRIVDNGGVGTTPYGYSLFNNINIHNNIFENPALGTGTTSRYYNIFNVSPIKTGSTWTNISFYNNVFLSSLNANHYTTFLKIENGGVINNLNIKNNIIKDHKNAQSINIINNRVMDNIHIDNNCLYNNASNVPTITGNIITNYTFDHNINNNPLFISSTDYHLQSGSTLINAGVDVGLPYSGSTPDIGAYETNYYYDYNGPVYYVSTTGNDSTGNGSIDFPVKTFEKAVTLAITSGDIINFGVGTFLFTTVNVPVGVSIVGQGDTTILQSNYVIGRVGGTTGGSINLISANEGTDGNQTLSNFKLIGTGSPNGSIGIVIKQRNNVIVHDLTIFDFEINGISFIGASTEVNIPTIYATGNKLYNCDIRKCGTADPTFTTWKNGGLVKWAGQDGMLIYDNYFSNKERDMGLNDNIVSVGYANKGCKYYNNESYKPDDDGEAWNIHIESWELEGGFEIYNNKFIGGGMAVDCAGHYSNLNGYEYTYSIHDNYFAPNVQFGSNIHNNNAICIEGLLQQHIYVYNNHFYKNKRPVIIQGTSWGPSNVNNIFISKNLMESCGINDSGYYDFMMYLGEIVSGSTFDNINFFNNTITADVTRNCALKIQTGDNVSIKNVNFKNNIVLNCTNQTFMYVVNNGSISGLTVTNNVLYGNSNNNLPKFSGNTVSDYIIGSNVNSDPLFISSLDFRLQSGSPAINAGVDVGLPYVGASPDIGVFEYNGIYFDSIYGNDSGSGTTLSPYKSISKMNSILSTVNTGTTVYLKRGSEWSGSTITPTKSGSVSNPIVIDAYGTGEKPIISGFQTISNWTRSGSTNIWYKTISPQSIPNVVSVDGVNTPKGRFPKSYTPNGGYLTFESYTGNTSIYDSSLSGNPSWVGSEIVIRVNTWSIGNGKVTNHVGGTLTFTGVVQTPTKNGLGYFFQNDLKCLSEFGDWCYVSGNSTFYMHFGSENPTDHIVKVSVVDELIYSNYRTYLPLQGNYMTFNNLHLEGAIKYGIRVNAGTGIAISNCDFDLIGNNGIIVFGTTKNLLITNNNISNCNNQGMTVIATYPIIRYNNLTNIALFPGMGTETGGYSGIELNDSSVSGATIEYNTITNIGNNGIQLRGSLNVVKNNFISYFGLSTDDCGGIYCSGEASKGDKIIGNIILYGVGNRDGLNPSGTTTGTASEGIYLDSVTDNKEVCDNTVAYCGNGGIRTHDSYNIMITGNTLYSNHYNLYLVKGIDNPAYQRNITLRNNISVATNNNQYALYIYVNPNEDPLLFGTSDYNYLMRPTNDTTTIRTDKNVLVSRITTNYTLETWQGTGNDLNSHKSPISVSYSDQIYFDYNATQTNKTVSLNGYKDLDGNVVTGYTLKPYTSIVLLETGIYFDSINGDDSGSGTTVSPYKSISKLNSVLSTVSTGSTIYLKRGSFWSGSTITPTKSGSPDGIITIDSYSEGEKPIISGFQTINGWIQSGSTNIYYKVINPQSPPNMVTINGVNTPKGRYPKFNTPNEGYLTLDAFTGDTVATALSDTYLATAPNWTGAEVVIRVNTWSTEIGLVTSHIGNKITFTGVGQKIDKVGLGYFFQNDLKCLTEFGDWYYNSGNSTFYMCFGADLPNEHIVKVSVVDDNIYCNYRTYSPYARYMKFNNLILEGANKYGFHINSGTGTTLSNCDIRNAGNAGIYGYCGANFMAIGNTILDSNKNGIGINGLNAVIRYNNITNTGLFAGMKGLKGNGIEIIDVNNTGSTIEYNSILNSGANGVHLRGNYNLFKNNYVSYFGLTIDDCGGIYMSGQFYIGDKVIGNIFTYGIGNRNGLNPSGTTTGTACEGIYMDSVTANKEIYDNTIAFCGSGGIRTHDSYNIMITGNTLYSNRYGFYPVKGINNPIYHRNITFNKNIVVSTTDSTWVQYPYRILTNINENPLLFGSSDYNYIMKPINGDDNMINVQVLGVSQNYYNLSEWQTFSNYDLHSNDSPFTTTSSSQILFEYNTGLTNRTIVLGSSYKNVDGTPSNNSITLAPYTSIILLRDNGIYSYLIMDLSGRLVFNDLNRILFA